MQIDDRLVSETFSRRRVFGPQADQVRGSWPYVKSWFQRGFPPGYGLEVMAGYTRPDFCAMFVAIAVELIDSRGTRGKVIHVGGRCDIPVGSLHIIKDDDLRDWSITIPDEVTMMEATGRLIGDITGAERFSLVNRPRNLTECFEEMTLFMPADEQEMIKNMTDEDAASFHMGIGLWMRNNWRLWFWSPLALYFRQLGVDHADYMSLIVLKAFQRFLKGREIGLADLVKSALEEIKRQKGRRQRTQQV